MGYIGNKPTAVPLTSADIEDGVISAADLGANSVDSSELVDGSIDLSHLSASGTKSSSTYFRGDNSFATISAGTALTGSTNNTIPTVTGANAISGEANLQFDGTDLTVSTGNVVIGTAGKGIDFSAQTPTSATGATTTAELLDHYEEGTWTPTVGGDATYHNQHGKYTRIGRMVHMETTFQVNVLGTGSTTTMSGLPFSCVHMGSLSRYGNGGVSVVMLNPNPNTGTTVTFNGMTAAASVITDNLTIFTNGTQVCVSLMGEL